MNDELEKADSCLKNMTKNINMDENEIICILKNRDESILKLIYKYYKRFANVLLYEVNDENQDELLNKINGKYVLISDVNNTFDQLKVDEARTFCENNDLDILLSVPKINNAKSAYYDDFSSVEGVFSPRTLAKELFCLPKNNFNLYKTSFIRQKRLNIPLTSLNWDNIPFYYKNIFSAGNAGFQRDYLLCEEESYLSIPNIMECAEAEWTENSFEDFFEMIDDLLEFFVENNLYRIYKYQILNTIFNYFREMYNMNPEEGECYFVRLKKRVETFRDEINSDLVLSLTSENLKFYRNILDVNSTGELKLLDENEKLERENFTYHYLLDKFNTLILDLKNSNKEDNKLEIEEFPSDSKHKIVLDKFNNADGSGLSVTTYNGSLHFKVKCIGDGTLKFYFRGFELRDKTSKRMPLSIDLTKVIVNNEPILESNKVVYYEKPFRYNKEVKDGEIVDIYVEWLPLTYQSTYLFEKSEDPKLRPFATARFDIKNKGSKDTDIKIIKNSDKDSEEYCPIWFNNEEGKGTVLESSKGKIDFTIQCINAGKLEIATRSIDFRDKNRVRIPISIDLQKLTINNEVILNENKLISHNKPFNFTKEVRNNEKIRIRAQWTPITNKSTYEVEDKKKISPLLMPFVTARFDIKNKGSENNEIKILKNSDSSLKPRTPAWFANSEGKGTIVESADGKISLELQCINSGTLEIATRSIDFRDKNNKRVPISIDLKKLVINNRTILNKNTLITHNRPIRYSKKVENNEIVKIEAEWAPISYQSTYEAENERKISPLLMPFVTARFDIKNKGTENNGIRILKNSDSSSKSRTPAWFANSEGKGTIVESTNGKISLELQCINKGTLEIATRSMDFRDKNNKRIPINIDLKKLTLNERAIINKSTTITHNRPVRYYKKVENNEIIKIEAEWAPISHQSILKD